MQDVRNSCQAAGVADNPTARALLTLQLLQDAPGITAGRLARRLGVTDRAARRYVSILREAGIPVSSVRGPYGGYRLGRGLRLPPLSFTAAEALGLVMAVLDGHHDAADPGSPVGSALGAIIRALPEPVAAQAEAVRRTTSPAPDRGAARPDPTTTATLVQACTGDRAVRLDYRSEAGSTALVEVDPWGVVVRHGRWYLLCRSHAADARRAYRIDRVRAVELLDVAFSAPAGLDPVAALEEHLADGWEYATEVIVEAPRDAVARCVSPALGRLEALGPECTRLLGSTSDPWWYAGQLSALPAAYRIVGGPELRRSAGVLGRRLLDAAAWVSGGEEDG